jgi:hypothetical protein
LFSMTSMLNGIPVSQHFFVICTEWAAP